MEDELVWLKYNVGGQTLFQPSDGGDWGGAVFVPKNGLSLAQIPKRFLPLAMSKMCGCCGSERHCFSQPTLAEIEKWKNG